MRGLSPSFRQKNWDPYIYVHIYVCVCVCVCVCVVGGVGGMAALSGRGALLDLLDYKAALAPRQEAIQELTRATVQKCINAQLIVKLVECG